MKWKTKFILVFLTILVSSKVYKVSARPSHSSVKRNRAESVQEWNPSALHGAVHQSPTPHKSTIPSSESAQEWNPSTLYGATHLSPTARKSTIPSSTLRSGSVTTDYEGINLKQQDNFKWNMDSKNMNIGRKILTARKFTLRRAAKRHKAIVSPYTTGMSSSAASPLKKAFAFQTLRPTFATDVPTKRNSKSPVELTILPTDDRNTLEDMFSPPSDKAGTKPTEDKTEEEGDTNDDYSAQDRPRVTEHDRPTRSGTESKTQPLETGAHYEITSSGTRWNTAHDSRTGAEHKRRKRYKKRKTASRLTDDENEDSNDDEDDPGQSGSPIILAAVFAGILVLLCVFTGLARLWRNCKKRCPRRKDPEFGFIFPSSADFNEQLSEDEILFETMAKEREMETLKDCAKSKTKTSNPPSYHVDAQATWILTDTPTSTPLMVASTVADTPKTETCTVIDIPDSTHVDAQAETTRILTETPISTPLMVASTVADTSKTETCTVIDIPDSTHVDAQAETTRILTDTPTSTPLMVASTVADTLITEASHTVVDIPDLSSPDTSFTCSSLSDDIFWPPGTPQSSSSLTSVSSLEVTSELGICSPSSPKPSDPEILTQSASLASVPAMPLKTETKITIESPVSPTFQSEATIDVPTSTAAISPTIEPEVITPDPPSTRPVTCAVSEATVPVTVHSSSSSQSATPKQSSSLNLTASVSEESTMTVSMTTESGSSSRESCKTPVAPRDEVAITIEDDEDEVVIYTSENTGTGNTVIDISSVTSEDDDSVTPAMGNVPCVTTENVDDVTKSLENTVIGVTGEVRESESVTVENAMIDILGVTCVDENGVTVVENAVIEFPGITGTEEDRTKLVENAFVKISGEAEEREDGVTVVDNVEMEISDVRSKGENCVTVANATIVVSGVTSEQHGDGVMVVENAVVHLSGVTSEERDRVTVVKDAEIKICSVTSEDEEGVKVVDNAVINISNVTNELESVVTIAVDNNGGEIPGKPLIGGETALESHDSIKHLTSKGSSTCYGAGLNTGITQPVEGNKPVVNENREKRLLSSKALDEGASTNNHDANVWDSIYKERAKFMVDANKKRKKRLSSSMVLDKDTSGSPDANAWDSIYKNRAKLMQKQKKQKKGKGVKPGVFQHDQIPHSEEHIYSEISVVDHKKRPQVGCLCHHCEKHRQKSRGPRFFRLPRKFLSFKSKSSFKDDNSGYEACSSVKYVLPTSEACASTSSAAMNTPTSSATNAGEQQIHYLPNTCDGPGVILPRSA